MESLIVSASFHLNSNPQCSQTHYLRPMGPDFLPAPVKLSRNQMRVHLHEGRVLASGEIVENSSTRKKGHLDQMVRAGAEHHRMELEGQVRCRLTSACLTKTTGAYLPLY